MYDPLFALFGRVKYKTCLNQDFDKIAKLKSSVRKLSVKAIYYKPFQVLVNFSLTQSG
jgi:hypothetical protein